ncbi:MAG: protein kinase [Myxococcaceae bacterium]|nr:protein kinase [Myxococcaceae bacterium]
MAEARRSGAKPTVKRLVCPCGAPVTVDASELARRTAPDGHDGPLSPTVKPCGTCGRLLVVDDPNVGRVVLGKWRLERRLGQGGMGSVYLATELSVDRAVALKFLHPTLAERDEYRTRFEQEARIMARIEHPNLAHLYGVERDGTVPFLVMRYVSGRPLSRLMKDKKVLPLPEALPLVVQMAAALSALHARGYVHRDLKPGNVMVSEDGHVTLLDFGLTRSHNPNLTRPGVALGSPQYMSPEQVMAGPLDARSDLYTLGLLTSELLVGHRPYKEETTKEMLLQHLNEVPQPAHVGNPKVPEAVSQVLLRAMAKKATDRQPSVEAFVEQLLGAAKAGPVTLPRRETAEAMLAAVVRASPVPTKSSDQVEVAEVVGPETMSLPTPAPVRSDATPNGVPVPASATPSLIQPLQAATIVDLSPVSGEKSPRETLPDRPSAALLTEKVAVWEEPSAPQVPINDERTDPERARVSGGAPRVPLGGNEQTDPERVKVVAQPPPEPVVTSPVVRTEPARARASGLRTVILDDTGPMPRASEQRPTAKVNTDVSPLHEPAGLGALMTVGIVLLAVSAVVAVWFLLT